MLGLSYGEIFLILGATAALIGPKDLPLIARTAGKLAGRAIGYVQLARGQFDNVMQNTQFRQLRMIFAIKGQYETNSISRLRLHTFYRLTLPKRESLDIKVNKELQDTMAQLDAIRHEIRSISIMNPGPLTRKLMDNPDQSDTETGGSANTDPSNINKMSTAPGEHHGQHQQSQQLLHNFKTQTSTFKVHDSVASGTSNLFSQATTYARLAESPSLKTGTMEGSVGMDTVDDRPGLLSVLPVSAESAGLLPERKGEVSGSDILLEAVLEAEVARNAKDFFSQPQNQIKIE